MEVRMAFRETRPELLSHNPFTLIGANWMLITAGTQDRFNTMTASWGGLGVLWERKVCTVYVRPTRYTYRFIEEAELFTLSFFAEQYRNALLYCGTHSGRDSDKVRMTGLTPVGERGAVWFDEARLMLLCRKIYSQDIAPEHFLDPSLGNLYPQKDYHRMYVGEITRCLIQEG